MKIIFLSLVTILLIGCTRYSHLEKGEDNEYYLVQNSQILFFSFPSVEKCTLDENNKFKCNNVK